MKERLQALRETALQTIREAADVKSLEEARVRFLGKKGEITAILRGMKDLSAEERPVIGQLANDVREALEKAIEERRGVLEKEALEEKLKAETLDVTLPGRPLRQGVVHPLNQIIEEVEDIFIGLGFEVAEGPEVETDYYNFEALNLPKEHPARDMQDSFYITDELLLRTHTSPVQAQHDEAKERGRTGENHLSRPRIPKG